MWYHCHRAVVFSLKLFYLFKVKLYMEKFGQPKLIENLSWLMSWRDNKPWLLYFWISFILYFCHIDFSWVSTTKINYYITIQPTLKSDLVRIFEKTFFLVCEFLQREGANFLPKKLTNLNKDLTLGLPIRKLVTFKRKPLWYNRWIFHLRFNLSWNFGNLCRLQSITQFSTTKVLLPFKTYSSILIFCLNFIARYHQ